MESLCGAMEDAEDEEFPRDPSPSGVDRNFDAVEERNYYEGEVGWLDAFHNIHSWNELDMVT